MIAQDIKKKIKNIWDDYSKSDLKIRDTKANELPNIRESRLKAIDKLQDYISDFMKGASDIYEFKTNIDSFNKRNNLWGFTAIKGQMFFNQLVKNNEHNITKLTSLIKQTISEPDDLTEALKKIEKLEKFCSTIYNKAEDKRKAPKPSSVPYFLSYFWQINDYEKWPIFYTSLLEAFKEIGIWEQQETQKDTYKHFYHLNEEIKKVLSTYIKKKITNWDVEHAFWHYKGNTIKPVANQKDAEPSLQETDTKLTINASFDLTDYLVPKVANLMELGKQDDKSSSSKGSEYEQKVAEIFKLLDFEVDLLGQGKGRNPDAIIKYREDNTAFIVDAKAYGDDYNLGTDDRAIREYINHYCPKLLKEGYKKVGFIIVSNTFKSSFESFTNEITWKTDIKRFILLSSEALLYLLAYKTKDQLNISSIIETLIGIGNPVMAQNIIEEFDDI